MVLMSNYTSPAAYTTSYKDLKYDKRRNNTFKLCFEKIYETMELAGRDKILHIKQLTNNGSQASTKEKTIAKW